LNAEDRPSQREKVHMKDAKPLEERRPDGALEKTGLIRRTLRKTGGDIKFLLG